MVNTAIFTLLLTLLVGCSVPYGFFTRILDYGSGGSKETYPVIWTQIDSTGGHFEVFHVDRYLVAIPVNYLDTNALGFSEDECDLAVSHFGNLNTLKLQRDYRREDFDNLPYWSPPGKVLDVYMDGSAQPGSTEKNVRSIGILGNLTIHGLKEWRLPSIAEVKKLELGKKIGTGNQCKDPAENITLAFAEDVNDYFNLVQVNLAGELLDPDSHESGNQPYSAFILVQDVPEVYSSILSSEEGHPFVRAQLLSEEMFKRKELLYKHYLHWPGQRRGNYFSEITELENEYKARRDFWTHEESEKLETEKSMSAAMAIVFGNPRYRVVAYNPDKESIEAEVFSPKLEKVNFPVSIEIGRKDSKELIQYMRDGRVIPIVGFDQDGKLLKIAHSFNENLAQSHYSFQKRQGDIEGTIEFMQKFPYFQNLEKTISDLYRLNYRKKSEELNQIRIAQQKKLEALARKEERANLLRIKAAKEEPKSINNLVCKPVRVLPSEPLSDQIMVIENVQLSKVVMIEAKVLDTDSDEIKVRILKGQKEWVTSSDGTKLRNVRNSSSLIEGKEVWMTNNWAKCEFYENEDNWFSYQYQQF